MDAKTTWNLENVPCSAIKCFLHEEREKQEKILKGLLIQWQEEIFADIYGCLVAGPAIAKSFQDLLFDNYTLTESDGVHPIPLIRPYIYAKVLETILSPILVRYNFR